MTASLGPSSSGAHDAPDAAAALNRGCFCFALDRDALARGIDAELASPELAALVHERCPELFAAQPVFVAARHLGRMAEVVRAVESVVALPAWRKQALAEAPAIARQVPDGPRGAFLGYDFHLEADRLGLIEINTNPGGALLNTLLARAERTSCAPLAPMVPTPAQVVAFESELVAMFRTEWRLAGRGRPLAVVAIVDEAPREQYLYPEFLLFARLLESHGLRTVVCDPAALDWRDGVLRHGDLAIDLVYNRLTDFYLAGPASAPLRAACLAGGAVVTPHPRAHALYADKRRLATLGDEAALAALGVPAATRRLLAATVPRTEVVDAAAAPRLWAARRGLFFKPAAGFGSRAAYRGDKLTRRVWEDIVAGGYVAQAIVAPGSRRVDPRREAEPLKFDLRAYAYAGAVQWMAARLYRGQTTNFRTPGGGFAPVYSTAGAVCAAAGPPSGEEADGGRDSHLCP